MKITAEKLLDLMETVLGTLVFIVMFGSIVLQVFFRYVLNDPLVWPFELSVFCYIYLIYIGSVMATRRQTHVAFDMLYERFSRRTRLKVNIASNVFIAIVFMAAIPSSIGYIKMVGSVPSSALGIPWWAVLAVFPLGMGLMALTLALRAVLDLRRLISREAAA